MTNSFDACICYLFFLLVTLFPTTLRASIKKEAFFISDTVNVKKFGAKGDGTTDDTRAIMAALKTNAQVVFFPAGIYRISQSLSLHSNLELLGESQKSILQNTNVKEILKTFGPVSYQNITLKGLTINGNVKEEDRDKLVICVQFYNVAKVNIINCSFNNASASLGFQTCRDINIRNSIISGMYQQPLGNKATAGVYGYGIVLNECSNALIEDNRIGTDIPQGYIMRHAIYISNTGKADALNSSDITIRKNTIVLKDYIKSKPMTGFEYVFKSVGGKNIVIQNNKTSGGVGAVLLTYNFINAVNIHIIDNEFASLNRYGVFINPEANANKNCLLADLEVRGNSFSMNAPNAQAFRVINYKTLRISNNNFSNQCSSIDNRSIFMYIKKNNSIISSKEIDISNNKVNGFSKMVLNDDPKDNTKLFIR